jgi:hypothetical protein
MQDPSAMTWRRLTEKLRAHGMPGWCDEFPKRAPRDENAIQLSIWESEGGRTSVASARTFSPDASIGG